MLAGLPQAPSRYSPYTHWPEAKARQRYVLERMDEVGFIDREHARRGAAASRSRWPAARAASRRRPTSSSTCAAARGALRRTALYELGLRVHTTRRPAHAGGGRGGAARRHRRARRRGWAASAAPIATWRTRSARPTCELQAQAFKGMDAPEPGFSYEARGHRRARRAARACRSARSPAISIVAGERQRQARRRCSSATSIRVRVGRRTATTRCASSTIPSPLHRGRAGRARPAHRRRQGHGRRLRLRPQPVQPRHPGQAPAGLGVQAAGLRRGARPPLHAGLGHRRRADLLQRQRPRLDAAELREEVLRPDHAARGADPLAQRRHRQARRPHRRQVPDRLPAALRHAAARCRATCRSRSAPPR